MQVISFPRTYLRKFAQTYNSYRVGVTVWLCRWGHDECREANYLQAAAHDYLREGHSLAVVSKSVSDCLSGGV